MKKQNAAKASSPKRESEGEDDEREEEEQEEEDEFVDRTQFLLDEIEVKSSVEVQPEITSAEIVKKEEEPPSQLHGMDSLPREIWIEVFSFLPWRDLCRVLFVSKLANELGWACVKNADFRNSHKINNSVLQSILSKLGYRLIALNLTGCIFVTNEAICKLSQCTTLTSLNLSRCSKLETSGVHAISHLPRLTKLNISSCFKLRDQSLTQLPGLTSLRRLNVSLNPSLSNTLVYIADLKNLVKLRISNCLESNWWVLAKLPTLQFLDCALTSTLRPSDFQYFTSLTRLEYLSLFGCSHVNDTCVQYLTHLVSLRTLVLYQTRVTQTQLLRQALPNLTIQI